jgi:antitoxin MazE
MRTRVQKWGNSLALRIPRSVAKEARLEQDTPVELRLVNGRLIVSPVAEDEVTLEKLLAGITDENIHDEVDWGPAVGKEAW